MNSNVYPYSAAYSEDSTSVLMTAYELADYLGIGRDMAYTLLKNGEIKGFRIGCTWRISREAVDLYIREKSGMV